MRDVSTPHELSASDAQRVVDRARRFFAEGGTRSLEWRLAQLKAMSQMVETEKDAFLAALARDLGKPSTEGWLTELVTIKGELKEMRRGLRRWARTERARIPLAVRPGRATIRHDPLGVVLVVSPWNYPINLVLAPLAAALSAGNSAIVKPSEFAPATSALLAKLLARYLTPDAVQVIEGGAATTQALISAHVDHVFFTGSAQVGRLVTEAASRCMTPVTLELGGKSPALIHRSAKLDLSAKRITWGKFVNAGQTCVAPDFVLVDRDVRDRFVEEVLRSVRRFYGDDPLQSSDYGRIVNAAHFERLRGLLSDHGGTVVIGGVFSDIDCRVPPTVVVDPDPSSKLMTEEIFGPILPVISYSNFDKALEFLNARPTPLTMSLFCEDGRVTDEVFDRTQYGSVTVNTTLEHFAIPRLPFGGLGASGIGDYHGRHGYNRLSQQRSVFKKSSKIDLGLAYPPYTERKASLLRRIL